jgi:hypothetical protein
VKTASIILCIALLFNSVFYSISLNVTILDAKFEAKEKLSKQISIQDLTLIKIPADKSIQIEENELWYNRKLYDISTSKLINDTVYYYVLEDPKEEETIGLINEHFNSEYNSLSPQISKPTFHKSTVKGMYQLYCSNLYGYKLYRSFSFLNYNDLGKACTLGTHTVLTPPPRDIFISNFNI